MVSSFACPECGTVVGTRRATAGRQVRCSECGTLVEIPFLPRAAGGRRAGRRSSRTWVWAAVGLLLAVVMVVGAVEVARGRGHAARGRELAAVVARSEAAEASGRFDEALAACEQAIKMARTLDPPALKPLRERRDRLAMRDSEARLAAVEGLPDPIEGLRALRVMVESDPGREPVRDRVIAALAAALSSRSETDLEQAARALAAGQPAVAMSFCERVARVADELGYERAGGLREAARAIAERIVGRYGVVFAPVTGEFVNGANSARLHASALHPAFAAALGRKGFLPRPEKSPFLAVWDQVGSVQAHAGSRRAQRRCVLSDPAPRLPPEGLRGPVEGDDRPLAGEAAGQYPHPSSRHERLRDVSHLPGQDPRPGRREAPLRRRPDRPGREPGGLVADLAGSVKR